MIMRSFTPLLGSSAGPSELRSTHVRYYESVSISDRFVGETLSFIIHHCTARLNERIHALMKQHHPHLLSVFFQSTLGSEMEFKHSIMEFTVRPSFSVKAMVISLHLEGLDELASVSSSSLSANSGSGSATPSGSNLTLKSAVTNFR